MNAVLDWIVVYLYVSTVHLGVSYNVLSEIFCQSQSFNEREIVSRTNTARVGYVSAAVWSVGWGGSVWMVRDEQVFCSTTRIIPHSQFCYLLHTGLTQLIVSVAQRIAEGRCTLAILAHTSLSRNIKSWNYKNDIKLKNCTHVCKMKTNDWPSNQSKIMWKNSPSPNAGFKRPVSGDACGCKWQSW